jgi:regulator of sigma E protease
MAGADVPLWHSQPPVVGSIEPGSPAENMGIRLGDRIVSINDRTVSTWDELSFEVLPRANRELDVIVDRGGERLEFIITPEAVTKYEMGDLGIGAVDRPQLTQVMPGSAAAEAGMQRGDVLLRVNGEAGLEYMDIVDRIRASASQPLVFEIERDGRVMEITAVPHDEGGIGRIGAVISAFEVRRVDPTVWEAFGLSAQQNWENTVLIGRTLQGLFTRDTPVRQLMGPVGIAELSGSAATLGWSALFALMAMISLNLGLLNLMPVPVLDGGHIAILAVEGLARRDLSVRVKERVLLAGAAVIVLLMVTVIYNDIARLLR